MDIRQVVADKLARCRRVEDLVQRITGKTLDADLHDLCQMVYLVILTYDADKIEDLWTHGEIDFFLARIIRNQYFSKTSPFYRKIRKFRDRSNAMNNGEEGD